ncbi:MAG TPA: twin-arginine translocase subunit TatC [Hyphomicrobiaceae bacterium]|nr:twin-arginine translocase subunit TatC [Hyphomicrobiaceae bacterium]
MEFVVGSAIVAALVMLIFAASGGRSATSLRALRNYAYVLCFSIAAMATGADLVSLMVLALPAVALYELAAFVSG